MDSLETGLINKKALTRIMDKERAEKMGQNSNIGYYYPFFLWYPWFYYPYYPYYYYYYERLPANKNFTLFFGGIPEKDLQKIKMDHSTHQINKIGESLNQSQNIGLGSIRTHEGEAYSTIWNKSANQSDCNHYIRTEMMQIWLEYGKDKANPLCPVCAEDKLRDGIPKK